MQRFFKKFFSIVVLASIFAPVMVGAQINANLFPCNGVKAPGGDTNVDGAVNNRECTFQDLITTAQAIANTIVKVGLIVSPLIFAYAGWLLLSSGDNPKNRTKARSIAINVAIGLAIMMLAWVAINFILSALVYDSVVKLN